jgi:hypothetical protein
MILPNGQEITLFEKDEELGQVITYYKGVLEEIIRNDEPPIESFFVRKFKDKYNIRVTEEEMEALKDFMDNEYNDWAMNFINRARPIL